MTGRSSRNRQFLELQDFGKEDGLRGEIIMAELPKNEIVDDRHMIYGPGKCYVNQEKRSNLYIFLLQVK